MKTNLSTLLSVLMIASLVLAISGCRSQSPAANETAPLTFPNASVQETSASELPSAAPIENHGSSADRTGSSETTAPGSTIVTGGADETEPSSAPTSTTSDDLEIIEEDTDNIPVFS